jgi:hypothetical protein
MDGREFWGGVERMKVSLTRDPYAPLWCLTWLNPPTQHTWDRPGIASSDYLCGYLTRSAALAHAAREGWDVVPGADESRGNQHD